MSSRTGARARPITPVDAIAEQLRLTAEDGAVALRPGFPTPRPIYTAEDAPSPADAFADAQANLDALESELQTVKAEINVLRRRDETLKFYMARLDEELRLAARLQQDFLPKSLPQVGPVHFHTLFRPAGYVSGDLYDLMRLDEHHVGFFVVDAVGHGMPAALLTMFIKRALITKEIIPNGYRLLEPAETLSRINDALIEQQLSQATFATAVYGVINTQSLTLKLASGGHPFPLLLRGDQLTELKADGPLLGIFASEIFTQATTQLQPGDKLFIYSDGLEVSFGEDAALQKGQWREEIRRRHAMGAEAAVIDLADHLDRESGSLQPKDDLTLVVAEIR